MKTLVCEAVDNILSSIVPDANGCHIWPKVCAGPYPRAWIEGSNRRLNRYVLQKKLGRPILPGMQSLHRCNIKMCVFGDHLYEGTPAQNTQDMIDAGTTVCNFRPKIGESNGNSKLDEDKVVAIRLLYRAGGTQQYIADTFGVTQLCISHVVRRKTWRHVE